MLLEARLVLINFSGEERLPWTIKITGRDDIDLAVRGSHGYGRGLGWALGSVTNNVVRHRTKPVAIFKVSG